MARNRTLPAIIALLVIALTIPVYASPASSGSFASVGAHCNAPMHFTENKGQWDSRVLYKAEGAGGLTYFIERDGFTLLFSEPDTTWRADFQSALTGWKPVLPARERTESPPSKSHALKFKFIPSPASQNANSWFQSPDIPSTATSASPSGRLSWNNNYFLGNDPSHWAPNCGNFGAVKLNDVWKGIDVEWYESNGHAEFDFVVNPGADPSQVGLRVDGLTGDMEVTGDGEELLLPTSLGTLRFTLPEAYQAGDKGKANPVPAHFFVTGSNRLGIVLPEGYDAGKKLIVDPLVYSTYLGGAGAEIAEALVSDSTGDITVAGGTFSSDFPTTEGALDRSFNGNWDVIVTRVSRDGSQLIYSTYIGGSGDEEARGIAPEEAGGVVVAGFTSGNNFPTTEGAFDRSFNGGNYDIFLSRLSGNGSELRYATYLGGRDYDAINALISDGAGGVVVAGETASDNFPTTGEAFDRSFNGGSDAYVTHLNADGTGLVYSTFLGGSYQDCANALAQGEAGSVIVAGATENANFPTTDGAFDRSFNGDYDAFVSQLSEDGSELVFSTFLGGSGEDNPHAVISDGERGVIVAGATTSDNFPTLQGSFDRSLNGVYDAIIARLSADGSQLLFSTYLGGSGSDEANAITLDRAGDVVVAGFSEGNDFPTTEGAFDRSFNGGSQDVFIACLSRDESRLLYGTYLGGGDFDDAKALTLDEAGGVIVAGTTKSNDFPTTAGAFDRSYNGGDRDAFIANLDIGLPSPGLLFGHVYSVADGSPQNGACVFTSRGDTVITNGDGFWFFDRVRSGRFDLTVSKTDFLDSMVTDLEFQVGDTMEINFSLRFAECRINLDEVQRDLAPNADTHVQFSATNAGNGPLTYTVDRRLFGDANAAPWANRRNFNVGATLSDDRIEGVAFDGDYFYLAGANGANPNTIYVINRDGSRVNAYNQPGNSMYGMKDLEWDGELLWGSGEAQVYGFRPNGENVVTFHAPYNPNNNIAYDSDNDLLWLCGTTTNISAYDREGNAVGRVLNRKGMRIYGLAYWPQDPDGYNLYMFDQPAAGVQVVYKMNTNTGDTLLAHTIPSENGEAPSGIFICNTYDLYSWVMMSMHNVSNANGGDRLSIWQLAGRKDWMAVTPTAGMIEMGERQDFDLHLDAAGLPAADFHGELVFLHDGIGGETHLPITMNVVEGQQQAERNLHLVRGWNLVSANVRPDEQDVCALTQPLVEGGQLVMMKDHVGHFYVPHLNFNNIPCWDVAQGYLVEVSQDADLHVTGLPVAADDPIALREGWQMVAYYPRQPVNATTALGGIADHLIMAKDGLGRFYVPGENFCNMGQMVEGQGYRIKSDQDIELVYQLGGRRAGVEAGGYASVYDRPCHYPVHPPTDANMSLLLKAPGIEGDIGVYANGELVGSGVLDRGMAGIAVWGDDPTTEAIDGAKEGEPLELRLWDGSGERRLSVAVLEAGDKNVAPPQNGAGELAYHADGLLIAGVAANSVPSDFSLTAAYPNPFNSTTRIGFALPTASRVSVRVFDLSGREVATLVSGQLAAGTHTAIWNAEAASAGVYLVKMEAGSFSAVKKLMLVK